MLSCVVGLVLGVEWLGYCALGFCLVCWVFVCSTFLVCGWLQLVVGSAMVWGVVYASWWWWLWEVDGVVDSGWVAPFVCGVHV